METDLSISMLMDCLSDDTLLALVTRSEHLESRFSYYEQIADGMAYLHDRHFIHGCLQAKFIYVTPNGRAIIGQLARATLVHLDVYDDDVSQVMEQPFENPPTNTIRWMSKETNESRFMTQKSDVHSFGVLIWEAENALCQPSDTPSTHLAPYSHVEYDQVVEVQRQRHTLPQSPQCPDWLYEFVKAFTANPCCRRPSFPEAKRCLQIR
ncbi:hypothetical protein NP493_3434g00001 [Ridgeia piscesae]|uniref:Protein kinase domain-containing protein n=1 Tax=Ridgeia piscesae TaxID=27915 RepID=A0AAD9J7A6_RIDPI|nr:hypothetical protein NP493_3434g00001 [Ridgeia piscesae]